MSASRSQLADTVRFWEIARVPYNLLLVAVTVGAFFNSTQECPGCRATVSSAQWLELGVYALVANAAYCAVYFPILFSSEAALKSDRSFARVAIWAIGSALIAWLAWMSAWGLFYPY